MQMMIESYFNLHYYGYGMGELGFESDEEDTEEEVEVKKIVEVKEEEVVYREFPFDDEVFRYKFKAPRVRVGWDNLPMEVRSRS